MRGKRLAAAGVVVVMAVSLHGCGGGDRTDSDGHPPSKTATSTGATATLSPSPISKHGPVAAVTGLLRRRARALLHHDKGAFLHGIDRAATGLRADQAAFYRNVRAVPLATWKYRIDPKSGLEHRTKGADSWEYTLYTTYGFEGVRGDKAVQRQRVDVAKRMGGWRITEIDDLDRRPEVWDLGKATAVRSEHVVVIGVGTDRDELRDIRALAREAVPRVNGVWERKWAHGAVIAVPKNASGVDRLVEKSGLEEFAAVAAGETGINAKGDTLHWDRIVINPRSWKRMESLGRRVVLTHEMTHLATGSLGSVPTWVSEGFADYVGWKDSGVPARYIAQELAARVRDGHVPHKLPEGADFRGGHVDEAYEEAWLTAKYIVFRYGESKLIEFYETMAAQSGTGKQAQDRALRKTLGVSRSAFTDGWSSYVEGQLS
ncbi:MAG: hypothetical protein ACRDMV_14445 [Streptosporangiales bacterium]